MGALVFSGVWSHGYHARDSERYHIDSVKLSWQKWRTRWRPGVELSKTGRVAFTIAWTQEGISRKNQSWKGKTQNTQFKLLSFWNCQHNMHLLYFFVVWARSINFPYYFPFLNTLLPILMKSESLKQHRSPCIVSWFSKRFVNHLWREFFFISVCFHIQHEILQTQALKWAVLSIQTARFCFPLRHIYCLIDEMLSPSFYSLEQQIPKRLLMLFSTFFTM